MIVEVVTGAEERPEARVVDVDDLAGCTWRWARSPTRRPPRCCERAGLGRFQDAEHRVPGRRRAARRRRAAGHGAGLERAVGRDDRQARSQGWLSADGATLQVQVESAAGA